MYTSPKLPCPILFLTCNRSLSKAGTPAYLLLALRYRKTGTLNALAMLTEDLKSRVARLCNLQLTFLLPLYRGVSVTFPVSHLFLKKPCIIPLFIYFISLYNACRYTFNKKAFKLGHLKMDFSKLTLSKHFEGECPFSLSFSKAECFTF